MRKVTYEVARIQNDRHQHQQQQGISRSCLFKQMEVGEIWQYNASYDQYLEDYLTCQTFKHPGFNYSDPAFELRHEQQFMILEKCILNGSKDDEEEDFALIDWWVRIIALGTDDIGWISINGCVPSDFEIAWL